MNIYEEMKELRTALADIGIVYRGERYVFEPSDRARRQYLQSADALKPHVPKRIRRSTMVSLLVVGYITWMGTTTYAMTIFNSLFGGSA